MFAPRYVVAAVMASGLAASACAGGTVAENEAADTRHTLERGEDLRDMRTTTSRPTPPSFSGPGGP